nr:uncharacterized protein LOC100176023 [Ciona intestinalis]|eukprot:XP_002131909.1 uncharacterized protein LOC100176023 [Ciona intestinalis]
MNILVQSAVVFVVFIEVVKCGRYVTLKDQADPRDADSDEERHVFKPTDEQPAMEITRVLDIGDNHKAWVIDNAIRYEDYALLPELVKSHDSDFVFAHQNYSKENKDWNFGSAPWVSEFSKDVMEKTVVWNNIKPMVEQSLEKKVKISYVEVNLLRALDAIPPQQSKFCGKNRFVLTFFLTDIFKLNSYGQLSFYAMSRNPNMSNESRLEVTETVHPHGFRATLWPACHTVLFRAPSVNFFQHLMLLHVVMTTDMESNEEIITPASIAMPRSEFLEQFGSFKFTNEDAGRKINYEQCLHRSFYDGMETRPIHIFDDLFTVDELKAWRSHIWKYNAVVNGFDSEPSEGHDNVQWMAAMDVDRFISTGMWPRLQGVLKFISNKTDWYPYDVALNYVRTADHTRIHPDAELHQDEFTLLLYLSEGLTPNEYGETTWVVMKKDDGVLGYIGRGGEVYESIAAVAPKFGRLVVFKNNIEHAAHPPSINFLGGRYSFAVKVGLNKRLAFIKRVYERMEGVEMNEHMKRLNTQLMAGMQDDPTVSKITTDQLVQLFQKVTAKRDKQAAEAHQQVFENAVRSL